MVPLATHAQQGSLPVIAFMSSRSPEDSQSVLAAFRKGLSGAGLVEGKNVVIEFRCRSVPSASRLERTVAVAFSASALIIRASDLTNHRRRYRACGLRIFLRLGGTWSSPRI